MNNNYQYVGESLTAQIAEELIIEKYSGQTVKKQEIVEPVVSIHEERGGLPSESQNVGNTILTALQKLKRNEIAKYNSSDGWQIFERPIGSGDSWVYLYYFPSARETAESQGQSVWPCKIGRTDGDLYRRVKQLTQGAWESPKIGILIRTDASPYMETKIHAILTLLGRHEEDAPVTEWFTTCPSEVEAIHGLIVSEPQTQNST